MSCTSRVLSSICGDGELRVWICGRYGRWPAGYCALHQCTAEWGGSVPTCYGESWLAVCGTHAEETPQSGGNHWIACSAAAELYAILCKVQPSSLCNCSTCLHKVQTCMYYIPSKISNRMHSLASLRSLMLAARQYSMYSSYSKMMSHLQYSCLQFIILFMCSCSLFIPFIFVLLISELCTVLYLTVQHNCYLHFYFILL